MTESRGETGWERLFWLVFERSSNPVALLDENRTIVQLNDAAVELFGGDRELLVGHSMADSVRPSERAQSAREWEEFLRTGDYSGHREVIRAYGSSVKVDFAARIASVDGERRAIYVAMVDPEHDGPSTEAAVELPLTAREREVVTLIALGRDTAEIAAELGVSPETVRSHVRNAMAKLDVHTRAQLVAVVISAEHALHDLHF